MLGSLPTVSQEKAHPGPIGSRRQHFMAPRPGPGCSVSCPPGQAAHSRSEHAHRGTFTQGSGYSQGTLLALLLCLHSPSTSSMSWTQFIDEKSQAELRLSWIPADTLRQARAQPCPQEGNIPVCQLTKVGRGNPGEWAANEPGKIPEGFLEEGVSGSDLEDKKYCVSCKVSHMRHRAL